METKLPKNWIKISLGKLISVKNGNAFKSKEYLDDGIPIIRMSDIKNGKIDISKAAKVKESKTFDKYIIDKGDLLIGMSGSIGKYGIFDLDQKVYLNQRVGNLSILNEKILNKNLLIHLIAQLQKEIVESAYGGTVPNISTSQIKNFKIPLPPRAEQDRIVAKLDTLFGQLEHINKSLDHIPTLLKNFRQQVLTQAVTGKLTEEWRKGKEFTSIENIVTRIQDRRAKSKSKKIRDLKIQLRDDLNLYHIPNSWRWIDLNFLMDESHKFRYGVVQPGKDINEQKLIRVKDISNSIVNIEGLRGISFKIDESYKTARVKEGDLIISIVGTIGRTAIIDSSASGFNIARALAKIPIRDFPVEYIKYFIDSSIGQNWLIGDSREVARKTLNLEQLKTLPIPVPPIEEQQEIVNRVENLFAKADAIEAHYEALKNKIEHLPQSILHKAFKGELVPQLNSDGDARELLREIEELKKETKPKKKMKKKRPKTYKFSKEQPNKAAEGEGSYSKK